MFFNLFLNSDLTVFGGLGMRTISVNKFAKWLRDVRCPFGSRTRSSPQVMHHIMPACIGKVLALGVAFRCFFVANDMMVLVFARRLVV